MTRDEDKTEFVPGLENVQDALRLMEQVRQAKQSNVINFGQDTDLFSKLETNSAPLDGSGSREPAVLWSKLSSGNLDHIGRFEIKRKLGSGGFATVFLALDPKLNRDVALKVPNVAAILSAEATERFEREAKAAGLLSHPDIVPVYEFGSVGPVSFICYEYCPGQSLAQWLGEHGKLNNHRSAAKFVARVADAVQHAHLRGVLHRDLKPANLMVEVGEEKQQSEDEPFSKVRITDFGLARNLIEKDQTLTHEGSAIGTPAYMSPEQARGEKEVGSESDVWSLGVILYQLLTSELPFSKESHLATLNAVENATLVPPRKLDPTIHYDLDAICQKCLNKSPAERYGSAFELSQDLAKWLEGLPVTARSLSKTRQVIRWARRNPALSASLTFAFASLAIGLSVATWQWRIAKNSLALAQTETVRANMQARRSERNLERVENVVDDVLNEVVAGLGNYPNLLPLRTRVLDRVLEIQEGLIEEEKDQQGTELDYLVKDTIAAYQRSIRIHLELGDSSKSFVLFEEAKQKIEQSLLKASSEDRELLALMEVELTLELLSATTVGREPEKSVELLDDIEKLFAKSEHIVSPFRRARIWTRLNLARGIALERLKKFEAAEASYLSALVHALRTTEFSETENQSFKSQFQNSNVLNSYGILLRKVGKADAARDQYLEALEILQKLQVARPDRIDVQIFVGKLNFNLANMYNRERDYLNSNQYYQAAVRDFEVLLVRCPDLDYVPKVLCGALQGVASSRSKFKDPGDLDEIVAEFDRALMMASRLSNEFDRVSNVCVIQNNLAKFKWRKANDREGAKGCYWASIETAKNVLEKNADRVGLQSSLSIAYSGLIRIEVELGELEKADLLADEGLEFASAFAAANPILETHRNLGYALQTKCTVQFARSDFENALATANLIANVSNENRFQYLAAETVGELLNQLHQNQTDLPPKKLAALCRRFERTSLDYLGMAVDSGFKNWKSLGPKNSDWNSLRDHPQFMEILEAHQ